MPIALGPTAIGLPRAITRALSAMAGSASRVSTTDRSSPAWIRADVVKLTKSSSSVGGCLRLSSVK
jgi:hypothetical protein